jgi:hypothetical protein
MSCAAFSLIRIRVQSTAWAVAKPITSESPASRSDAEAASLAAERRRIEDTRARHVTGNNEAFDMASA